MATVTHHAEGERRGRTAQRAVLISAALAFAACGPEDDPEASGDPSGAGGSAGASAAQAQPAQPYVRTEAPLPLEELASTWALALCTAYERCDCGWAPVVTCGEGGSCPADLAECVETVMATTSVVVDQYATSPGEYGPERGRRCVNAITDAPCDDANWYDYCAAAMWDGTVPSGGACSVPIECQGSTHGTADCVGGLCVAIDPNAPVTGAQLGESCGMTCSLGDGMDMCTAEFGSLGAGACLVSDGLTCIEGTCQPLAPLGGSCIDALQCESGLACVFPTCSERVPLGQPCVENVENPCEAGAYCAAGTCTAQKPYDASCEWYDECLDGACDGGLCRVAGKTPICEI